MSKYAVHYSDYAYIEAESEDEAQDKFYDEEDIVTRNTSTRLMNLPFHIKF